MPLAENRWAIAGMPWLTIAAFLTLWGLMWLPLAMTLANNGVGQPSWRPGQEFDLKVHWPLLLSLYAIAPLSVAIATNIVGLSWEDCGWGWRGKILTSMALGLGGAALALVAILAIEWSLGWIKWHDREVSLLPILLSAWALGLGVGAVEEMVFRGFILTVLMQYFTPWLAAIYSSILFALSHLVWERRQTLPQLPGLFSLGLVLAIARWVDGGYLGLAWGLHGGWVALLAIGGQIQCLTAQSRWGTDWERPLATPGGLGCIIGTGIVLGIWLWK